MNALRDAALGYASRGWHVFPCHGFIAGACTCGDPECERVAKHPLTRNGLRDGTTDVAQIHAWWTRWPNANIGIVCGGISGIFVVDVDIANGKHGDRTLVDLVVRNGGLGDALHAITGSGGDHYIFKHPGKPVRPTTSKLGPGLDVRGDGSYIIGAPSSHASGNRYVWCVGGSVIDAPRWLVDLVAEQVKPPPPPPREVRQHHTIDDHRALAVLTRECEFIRHAERDAATLTYEEWFSLGTVLAVFPAGPELFEEISAADGARYRAGEARKKIRSITGRPRHCTSLGWSCPRFGDCQSMGVNSPAGLPYKLMKIRRKESR